MESLDSDECSSVSKVGLILCVDGYELRFSATTVGAQRGAAQGQWRTSWPFSWAPASLASPTARVEASPGEAALPLVIA